MKIREQVKFTQTYVYRDNGDCFFVSTGYRKSSAGLNPDGWYFDTLAWSWDPETKERGEWVVDHSGAISEERALDQHFAVVSQLHKSGVFNEEALTKIT